LLVAGEVESSQVEVAMAGLRFFLPALFVLSAFGQSYQNAVDPSRITKEAVQAILGASLGQSKPVMNLMTFKADGPKDASSCSVPLIEVQISKDTNFVIAQVPPPSDFRDNMPVAKGLPACPAGR
jgi:hypothetical protein